MYVCVCLCSCVCVCVIAYALARSPNAEVFALFRVCTRARTFADDVRALAVARVRVCLCVRVRKHLRSCACSRIRVYARIFGNSYTLVEPTCYHYYYYTDLDCAYSRQFNPVTVQSMHYS